MKHKNVQLLLGLDAHHLVGARKPREYFRSECQFFEAAGA